MRFATISLLIFLALLLSGCGQRGEALSEEVPADTAYEEREIWGGFTAGRIRRDLMENSVDFPWEEILGPGAQDFAFRHQESILVWPQLVVAQLYTEGDEQGLPSWHAPMIFLAYNINWDWTNEEHEIEWRMVGYSFWWGINFTYLPENWQGRHRALSTEESVTIRIYSTSWDWPGEEMYYVEETIAGAALWEETIRLVEYHTNVQIWDFWYEGRRIVVDVKPLHWPRMTSGTMSFIFGAWPLTLTFASLPDVDEVEILFGGHRLGLCHSGSIYGYYRVGEWFSDVRYE